MQFTNNKKRTKGVVASAKGNATKNYQAKLTAYFQNLLSKTREEVVEIRLNLDKRFRTYIGLCLEAEKMLFNKMIKENN